jgi:hypothetical protein
LLAKPGAEFATGAGRVAVSLARRGVPVTGIELSRPMIEQLRSKADEAAIPVVVGDMATARAGRLLLAGEMSRGAAGARGESAGHRPPGAGLAWTLRVLGQPVEDRR